MDAKKIDALCGAYKQDKYAMYLRKSRADLEMEALGEGETLARHRHMLEALAERHGILMDQITVYQEIVSGDSIDERPEVQRLLNDIWANTYKGVLVVEVERLARGNTKDQGEVAEAFQASGTKIITPAKIYDPNNEFDQEYFEFGLFMSRREYKTIRRRLEAGKLSSVQEGNFLPSAPPYGFDIVRKSKRERYLVENPNESKYIKMIFNWYTEDRKPTSWIAKQLTLMGVPTRKGGEWKRATIKDILFNAHYIGMVSWGAQRTIKFKDPVTGKMKKKRTFGESQMFKGKHEGFISEEQFNKAKAIYGSQAPAKMNLELTNPLSGLLVCAKCGSAIGFQSYPDNRISRYHHPYNVYDKCGLKSLYVDIVNEALIDVLKAYIDDFQLKLDNGSVNEKAIRQQETLAAMRKELAAQQAKKRRLFDSWEADDGTYTKEEFLERKAMYTRSIEQLQAQIKALEAERPEPVDYAERIATIHSLIDCIQNPDMTAKEKNIFLKQFIEKITFDTVDLGYRKGGKAVLDVYLK